jgi:hypothetical protein
MIQQKPKKRRLSPRAAESQSKVCFSTLRSFYEQNLVQYKISHVVNWKSCPLLVFGNA